MQGCHTWARAVLRSVGSISSVSKRNSWCMHDTACRCLTLELYLFIEGSLAFIMRVSAVSSVLARCMDGTSPVMTES